MAVVYYPKQSIVLKRDTNNAAFEQIVLNTTPNTIFYFGSGSMSEISASFIAITASSTLNSLTSSYSLTASYLFGFIESASYSSVADSASYAFFAESASWAPSIPTDISISSSWASSSISSSYSYISLTASYAINAGQSGGTILTTGSFYPITSSWAISSVSSSYAPFTQIYQFNTTSASFASSSLSASYLLPVTYQITSSWTTNLPLHTSSWSENAIQSNTSLYASQSNWSVSASYASSSTIAGTTTNLGLTAYNISVTFASQSRLSTTSSWASSSLSSSFAVTASYSQYLYYNVTQSLTLIDSASWASSSLSSSYLTPGTYQVTSSWVVNLPDHTSSWAGTSIVSNTSIFASQSRWNISSSYASSSTTATNLGLTTYNISVTFASQSVWSITSSYASSSLKSDTGLIQNTGSNNTYYLTFTSNTGSYQLNYTTTSLIVNPALGRINATSFTGSFSGNLTGTASYALNIQTGGDTLLTTGSLYPITSSWSEKNLNSIFSSQSFLSISSSLASSSLTSSYLPPGTYQITASWVTNLQIHTSSWSGNSIISVSSQFASQSQWVVSASWTSASLSSSYAITALNVINGSNSASYALTASYAPFTQTFQTNTLSSSFASSSVSSSYFSVTSGSGVWKQYVDFSTGNLVFTYS